MKESYPASSPWGGPSPSQEQALRRGSGQSRARRPGVGDAPAAQPVPQWASLRPGALGKGRTRQPARYLNAQGGSPGHTQEPLTLVFSLEVKRIRGKGSSNVDTEGASHRLHLKPYLMQMCCLLEPVCPLFKTTSLSYIHSLHLTFLSSVPLPSGNTYPFIATVLKVC